MFADIVGSTQLIAGLDAEQAMERLQPIVGEMCVAVRRFEGTVVRTLGDGLMAVFGAPHSREGHALLACQAALAIQSALPHDTGHPTVRVGLHTGDVVSSTLYQDPTKERGAHGLTVHLAARLQEKAQPGSICITDGCYRLVRSYCDVEPLGRHSLKGFPELIELYALLRLKPAVASEQFRRANLTPFYGRAHELGILQRGLRRTELGNVTVVGIAGEPGTGKSRLCFEFAEWCRGRLIPVLEARAHLYGHATPLLPVLEFLRLLFGVSPADDPAAVREAIAQRIAALAPKLRVDLAVFYEFLGVADPQAEPSRLSPKARHAQVLEIIRHIIRGGGTRTNVIIVEDLHWLDEASEDFVKTLVDAVEDTRTMLVLNYRPSYTASWMDQTHVQQIVLGELSTTEIGALVQGLIGDRQELGPVRQQVAKRSGGNPFFAEELVRSLAENGAILGESGNYSLGLHDDESALPGTVQVVIGARIDRLTEQEKGVLQAAAIIGKEFPLSVLRRIVRMGRAPFTTIVQRLTEADLILQQRSNDEGEFSFRHPLIQEVAYSMQLKARRSILHAHVATAMAEHYRARLDEFSGLIAYHYEAAGQLFDAASYAARAAKWIGVTNLAQAIKYWHQVHRLVQRQPVSPATDSLRLMASGQIALFGWREGMTADEAKSYIREAIGRARDTQNDMLQMLLITEGRLLVASGGEADGYAARVMEALSLAKKTENVGRIATLNASLSHAYHLGGMLTEALAANTAALQDVSRIEQFDHQFLGFHVEDWARSLRGRILVRMGRLTEGQQCLDEMLEVEETLLDPAIRFIPHLGYLDLAWCLNDARMAHEHASNIARIAEKSEIAYLRVYSMGCNGIAHAIARDLELARSEFLAALEFARSAGAALEYEPEILASLADCYFRLDEYKTAIRTADEAIEVARRRSARLPECRAGITKGAALLAEQGWDQSRQADKLFQDAMELIHLTGAAAYVPVLERARTAVVT